MLQIHKCEAGKWVKIELFPRLTPVESYVSDVSRQSLIVLVSLDGKTQILVCAVLAVLVVRSGTERNLCREDVAEDIAKPVKVFLLVCHYVRDGLFSYL